MAAAEQRTGTATVGAGRAETRPRGPSREKGEGRWKGGAEPVKNGGSTQSLGLLATEETPHAALSEGH